MIISKGVQHKMNTTININKSYLKHLIKITSPNSDTLTHADLIMKDMFFLNDNLSIIDFTKGINWDYNHDVGPNTYKLYLHSLRPVSILCNAFEITGNSNYLIKALDITLDWNRFQSNNNHYFTWYDHSVASRTLVLTDLYILAQDHLSKSKLNALGNILIENINFLYDDTAYRRNNHGIMMDRALLQAGMIFDIEPSLPYVEKALHRIKDNFKHSFSVKSTHLENSPEYHKVVQDLFFDVEDFLQCFDLTLGEEIIHRLTNTNKYYRYITKPNGKLPLLGDTKGMNSPIKVKSYDSFIDSEAGIAILQNKQKDSPENSTWLSFIAGYSTLTHKHYDDLSFTLYANGEDIFVDSGKHSYGGSPIRKYIRSSIAHNTISINNRNYSLLDPLEANGKIGITDFTTNDFYSFVKGINMGYKDTKITRSIIHIKSGTIIILDKIKSNRIVNISQIFNLAPHISKTNGDKLNLTIKSKNNDIIIEQLNSANSLIVHNGNPDQPKAIISEKYGKTINIKQLEYTKKAKEDFFLTVITFNPQSKVDNIQFNEHNNLLSFNLKDFPVNLII